MWWMLVVLATAVMIVGVRELLGLRAAGLSRVLPGRHVVLGDQVHRPDVSVVQDLLGVAAPRVAVPAQRTARQDPTAGPVASPPGDVNTALVAGGLALGVGAADWWTVDPAVLNAVEQWTGSSVDNGLDLWRAAGAGDYQVHSGGFEIKLRGHVGEHEVESQLAAWADGRVVMPEASNNPAFDLTLDGNPVNVKVGQDAAAIRDHLSEHPDIPVLVNADMQGLPEDALHLDLNQPFDPDLLAEHSVIVADGLFLSDLQDSMADAFGPALKSFNAEDLFDSAGDLAVPVLGSAIRVVRSGVRENKLRQIHGDDGRALRNVGTDVALVSGGVAGGGALGMGLGALIDVATLGATAGTGMLIIGPAIGAFFGGRAGGKKAAEVRMRPLEQARAETTKAVQKYDDAVTKATRHAAEQWATVVVPQAEEQAATTAAQLKETAAAVSAQAMLDLATAAELSAAQREHLLDEASSRVENVAAKFRWHWLVQRQVRSWRTARDGARRAAPGALLDVVAAAPDGESLVHDQLSDLARRRATVLASAGIAAARLQRRAELERAAVLVQLGLERDELQDAVKKVAQPRAKTLRAKTEVVRRELVSTGSQTQEWVDEHFPGPS